MSDFDLRTANLRALNTMTKYPSIQTYHTLDPRNGGLLGEATPFDETVIGTEKVDGTNGRIIVLPDKTYLIGSRDELLYARGDLLANPALGIVDAVRAVADELVDSVPSSNVTTFYGEVYGHKIGQAAKRYAGRGEVGFRLFDVSRTANYDEVTSWALERISAWRDDGGQFFLPEQDLQAVARAHALNLTPRLFEIDPAELPTGLEETRAFLAKHAPRTQVALGGTTPGEAEGIVLRTRSRSTIAKARFQDYDRTLKRRGSGR